MGEGQKLYIWQDPKYKSNIFVTIFKQFGVAKQTPPQDWS
jgi:hypothetical protein